MLLYKDIWWLTHMQQICIGTYKIIWKKTFNMQQAKNGDRGQTKAGY